MNSELAFLEKAKERPYILLARDAKLLYEHELKLLETGNEKEALVSLRNQKMREIEKLNAKIEALEAKP
ncbi:MAG: hypothetical protein COV47_05845 [Candidatus Diapherotrites archaeon CG11_big_fil_rev_8_21_14_0_20_37_9]|nr:MAG: hypothetical protein COV47_05845 [Candidatus Diapherotrites archaeon CG11_big_fil_rev_8_21_14_0_20_37_9]